MNNKLVAITRNKEGKIEIFNKYTECFDEFEYEVMGYGNDVLCIYNENDVVNICSL